MQAPTQVAAAPDTPPRLPSPTRGGYGAAPGTPKDPLVAPLVRGRRWDEALAGAASAVALAMDDMGREAVQPWFLRESRYRAGYPWAISDVRVWSGPRGIGAPPQLQTWIDARAPGEDLGVVRARGRSQEHWVALAATPSPAISPVARQQTLGATLELLPAAGARWEAGGPDGRVHGGPLDGQQAIQLDARGEWVISLRRDEVELASMVLYVDQEAPTDHLLAAPWTSNPRELVVGELDRVRADWGAPLTELDTVADVVAAAVLADEGADVGRLGAELGLEQARAARCRVDALVECVDELAWSVPSRALLMRPDRVVFVGLASSDGGDAVLVIGTAPPEVEVTAP